MQPSDLPNKLFVYLAAGAFTFCNIGMSISEFLATKYDKDYAATMFSVYGAVQYLVDLNLRSLYTNKYQEDTAGLPELKPLPRDDVMVGMAFLCIITICLGNWSISKNYVTLGLYVIVGGSLGLAQTILKIVSIKTLILI